jgi:sarcosine oxidase
VLSGDALLVAAGPWSRALLDPDAADDLVLYRQSMLYCAVPEQDLLAWSAIPTIPSLGRDGTWLVPPVAGTPLKLSAASACRVEAEIGDFTTPAYWRERLLDALAPSIPGLDASWLVDSRDCYYLAGATTGGPVLHVRGAHTLAYAACGGSSFKFAPLIARSLAERLTGARPTATGLDPIDRAVVREPAGALAGAGSRNHSVMRGVS